MINLKNINFTIKRKYLENLTNLLNSKLVTFLLIIISLIAIYYFNLYLTNGLGLAYNDARSHLDIGRRVVEGLKTGLAQLGSVWLPLNHVLMVPLIWNDYMWHSGLAGSIWSMISFVVTALVVYRFLEELNVGLLGRIVGVFVFVANINVLYLQATAMTELLLLATMTLGSYELMLWHKTDNKLHLIRTAFWVMLSTLTRYDGWFLLGWAGVLVILHVFKKRGDYSKAEGIFILFCTLAGFGAFMWFLWNQIIFKDALYFAFGPFSAKAQQNQLADAGVLQTKGNLWLSFKFYMYALIFNSGAFQVFLAFFAGLALWFDKNLKKEVRIATTTLVAPFFFNILALFLGFSVLFIQGLSGDTWFNVRYGIMLAPAIAVFIGYTIDKFKDLRPVVIGLLLFVTFFTFTSADAVTIDDARVGSSQKNVSEVSGWLNDNAADEKGFVLISAASHDAIIFSSGMPMKRFIHEGTGLYWDNAVKYPDRWARWIIMRTYDDNDLTYRLIKDTSWKNKYNLVSNFPFADIYELKPEYLEGLNTEPVLGRQK